VTRIKMTEPSFAAFRTALADPEARVKLEAEVAGAYPRIVGARFIGGFLDQREIAFSPNLTCLIGGRGAGKSTAPESVRAACLSTVSEIDGQPNCPETVQLVYRDEYGVDHRLKRDAEKTTTGSVMSWT
jgi:predicted ATPase